MLPRHVAASMVLATIVLQPSFLRAQNCANSFTGRVPLDDLGGGTYQGQTGGLYPGGQNLRPWAHELAGLTIGITQILPRDRSGNVDLVNGRIAFASLGMSNTRQEFSQFQVLFPLESQRNRQIVLVNGAQGGMPASRWSMAPNPSDPTNVWTLFANELTTAGVTGPQLQVVWLKLAEPAGSTPPGFPAGPQQIKAWMQQAVLNLKAQYPNVRIVYFSSRIYAGYATTNLNPEPYAYETGFAAKWLIEDQIGGVPAVDYRGANPPAPWMSWGPYLWADGLGSDGQVGGVPGRSDGLEWLCSDLAADGTHPSTQGARKVAGILMNWLKSDITSAEWFLSGPLAPGQLTMDPSATATADGNGVFEPGETVLVAPSWQNTSGGGVTFTGTGSAFRGPVGATYTIADGSADYGSLGAGSSISCAAATGNCYALEVPSPTTRPTGHWDALFQEVLTTGDSRTRILHVGDSFADVPRSHTFYRLIETLLHNGVTTGCSATDYCPSSAVTRAQMAALLLRALLGSAYQPPPPIGSFGDVPLDHPFAAWIEELARRGITLGCGGGNYCPSGAVSRAQMAAFLLRSLEGGGYVPPAPVGVFQDVPVDHPFAGWIEELSRRGITAGCSAQPPLYCPASSVSRGQMAAFLVRAFGLVLYGS